ncbi:MAG: Rrf2 family transcriptional regulator [Burkholderiaceae bacterium]|jgi:Rrf2 family protein|nr:Rrf2 family transcriptional regulator [Aquabacterium sp.]NUP86186.1 Rrf2 family transcriptional regulator [Burkholderiaceae bacterium]
MKLQQNTRLALYSLLEFAADPTRHIAASEIAQKYGVSPHHLAKVLAELARAGVVQSVRGVGGGYRFAGNARRLTMMDIVARFEETSPPETEPTPGARAIARVLGEIDEIAKATFSSITLATLLRSMQREPDGAANDSAAATGAAPVGRGWRG